MANESPPTIDFGIGQGYKRSMRRLADGSYADVSAPAYGSGLVTDESGQHTFDLGSMPSRFKYDADGNQTMSTYGPDKSGLFVRQTSSWENGLLMGESAWFLVDALDAP